MHPYSSIHRELVKNRPARPSNADAQNPAQPALQQKPETNSRVNAGPSRSPSPVSQQEASPNQHQNQTLNPELLRCTVYDLLRAGSENERLETEKTDLSSQVEEMRTELDKVKEMYRKEVEASKKMDETFKVMQEAMDVLCSEFGAAVKGSDEYKKTIEKQNQEILELKTQLGASKTNEAYVTRQFRDCHGRLVGAESVIARLQHACRGLSEFKSQQQSVPTSTQRSREPPPQTSTKTPVGTQPGEMTSAQPVTKTSVQTQESSTSRTHTHNSSQIYPCPLTPENDHHSDGDLLPDFSDSDDGHKGEPDEPTNEESPVEVITLDSSDESPGPPHETTILKNGENGSKRKGEEIPCEKAPNTRRKR